MAVAVRKRWRYKLTPRINMKSQVENAYYIPDNIKIHE